MVPHGKFINDWPLVPPKVTVTLLSDFFSQVIFVSLLVSLFLFGIFVIKCKIKRVIISLFYFCLVFERLFFVQILFT